jgi:tetratricopeptide (TPR) repeat protein
MAAPIMTRKTPSPAPESSATDRRLPVFLCALLVAAVFAIYGQTLWHGFISYDDGTYITKNTHVNGGLTPESVRWAITEHTSCNWHPLTWLTHMLDCQLYGLEPGGHHATNVILHAAAAVFLLLALRRLTGRIWPSALAAALFALHPLRVESVAWISERKDVLSGLMFMLTLLAYARYTEKPGWPRYLCLMAVFALGLSSKPMLVTTPMVLLLLDYWPLNRLRSVADLRARFLEKLPLLAMSAASSLLTMAIQAPAMPMITELGTPWRVANAVVACAAYLGKMIHPVDLAIFYPHPYDELAWSQVVVALPTLAAITAAAAAMWRRHPYLIVGWLWNLGMLVPVIGLVQVGMQSMADRYTYLPQIGIYIAIAWGAAAMTARWPQTRGPVAAGAVAALILLAVMACLQTERWRSNEALWRHTLASTRDNSLAHKQVGSALSKLGRRDEALAEFGKAMALQHDAADLRQNMAATLNEDGRYDQALELLQEILNGLKNIRVDTDNPLRAKAKAAELAENLKTCHHNIGSNRFSAGRYAEAAASFQQALEHDPKSAESISMLAKSWTQLGIRLVQEKNFAEAAGYFERAVKTDPSNAKARHNFCLAVIAAGEPDRAVPYLEPMSAEDKAAFWQAIGTAHKQAGNHRGAIGAFREAGKWAPEALEPRYELALLLSSAADSALRDGKEALAIAERLVAITSASDPHVLMLLAVSLAENDRFDEALKALERAEPLARANNQTGLLGPIGGLRTIFGRGEKNRIGLPKAP